MKIFGVESVAVGFSLRIEHNLRELICGKELSAATLKYRALKEITRININYNLSSVKELTLNKRKLLIRITALADGGADDKNLVKGRCSLCNRHRVLAIERRVCIHLTVVEGVTKLVCERYHVGEGAVKVGKHSALSC